MTTLNCSVRVQVMTYSWDCDSQVHFNAWFDAGAQRVAPNQINGGWRCHVELTLCCFGRQKKRHFNCTRQPRQIIYLQTRGDLLTTVVK